MLALEKTVCELLLPNLADFEDYSSMALRKTCGRYSVAVVSQQDTISCGWANWRVSNSTRLASDHGSTYDFCGARVALPWFFFAVWRALSS